MPPSTDNQQLRTKENQAADLRQAIVKVWLLNLVPGLGLGFLYVTRSRGLPILFFVWMMEVACFNFSLLAGMYFMLSVLGTLFVIGQKYKPVLTSIASEANYGIDDNSQGAQQTGSIRADLKRDSSEFALTSFDRKLKAAESALAKRNIAESGSDDRDNSPAAGDGDQSPADNGDQSPADHSSGNSEVANQTAVDDVAWNRMLNAVTDTEVEKVKVQFAGTKSESADEAGVFGPDPFPDNAATALTAANAADSAAYGSAPASAADSATYGAAPTASYDPGVPVDSQGLGLDPAIYRPTAALVDAADSVAFKAVQADSIGDEARLADQITASFAAENATASAGLLDSAAQADAGHLIQPDPTVQLADAVASDASKIKIEMPKEEAPLGFIPGLGEIPGLGLHGLESSLGVVPGLPSLTGAAIEPGANTTSGVATAGSTGAAQSAKCPKCGADLQGQFSFCLSCLSPL